jgi:hypothetical protein
MQVREVRINGCDLVFLAKSKDGDHHQEMNSVVFLQWFEHQLMAALKINLFHQYINMYMYNMFSILP